jgi:cardiolipin-specific phospholipase
VGIESFILVGHSFGGYISCLYLEKYPQRVQQLIFLSPAGSGKMSDEAIQARARGSKVFFCLAEKIYNLSFRPSKIMNAFFIGNKFIERVLNGRLKLAEEEKSAWRKYLKHIIRIEDTS